MAHEAQAGYLTKVSPVTAKQCGLPCAHAHVLPGWGASFQQWVDHAGRGSKAKLRPRPIHCRPCCGLLRFRDQATAKFVGCGEALGCPQGVEFKEGECRCHPAHGGGYRVLLGVEGGLCIPGWGEPVYCRLLRLLRADGTKATAEQATYNWDGQRETTSFRGQRQAKGVTTGTTSRSAQGWN